MRIRILQRGLVAKSNVLQRPTKSTRRGQVPNFLPRCCVAKATLPSGHGSSVLPLRRRFKRLRK